MIVALPDVGRVTRTAASSSSASAMDPGTEPAAAMVSATLAVLLRPSAVVPATRTEKSPYVAVDCTVRVTVTLATFAAIEPLGFVVAVTPAGSGVPSPCDTTSVTG